MHAEIIPDFTGTDIRYIARVNGAEVGRFYTYAAADAAITPDYSALLDCAGPDVPLDGPSVEEEGGEGGEPPPDDYISAPSAHVTRALRDLAASPTSPAPSPLQPAPVGDAAASTAGLWFARQRWAQQRAAALGLTHGRAA